MNTPSTKKYPAPLYAAAGAGDLAYQQLRKLPEKVAELRGRVSELRPAVTDAVGEQRRRVDLDRLRDIARRNAAVLQERAVAVYGDLVARGERVVSRDGGYGPMRPAGDLAKIDEPAGLPSAETPSAAAASGSAKTDTPSAES
jgi:heparin binding hemagglutinin HbhA